MVTLRSKSAPRKSKRLEKASKKVETEQKINKIKNGKLSKKKQVREKTSEEIKEEYVTPPPSRAPSPPRSPIYIPHDGPVVLDVVVSRRNKRQPSYKPKNNDWIKKSSKIEFVGPERRLFRASVQRRGHKKQREYILVDYLYKNSYKTKLPPKNLWLDEPDFEFFPMQKVKGDNNNEAQPKESKETTAKKGKSTTKKPQEPEKPKKTAPRSKSVSRPAKLPKEKTSKPQATQRSKSVPKVATTPKKKTSARPKSEMNTPSRKPSKPRSEERPAKKSIARRESSSPKLPIPYSIFPSPPSESSSKAMSLPPPIQVPEDPVHILTSTPNPNVGKPKAFRPWPMRVRKPILAGSASPRSIHSADRTSLDLFIRNRRLSGVSHPGQSDIDEEEDFDNEVTMLSPRRERIYSQQATPSRPSQNLFSERRLSSHSQPAPQLGRVLSMPPPASSGSRSPSISVSSLGSGPRRVPNKRWDAIYAHKSPQKKLHHSLSQPAILPSSTRSLHGDFMSQTASSQPQETSTNIHRSANSSRVSFLESGSRTPLTKRRSLNPDITLEDEEEMNDEADSIQMLKVRTPKSRPGRIPTSDAIWEDEINKIKF